MNRNELEARIKELDSQIKALSVEHTALRQRHAEMIADFKIGDRVKIGEGKFVWELKAIRPGYHDTPKYIGAKIKKDGTPGVSNVEIWVPFGKRLMLANVEVEGRPTAHTKP